MAGYAIPVAGGGVVGFQLERNWKGLRVETWPGEGRDPLG